MPPRNGDADEPTNRYPKANSSSGEAALSAKTTMQILAPHIPTNVGSVAMLSVNAFSANCPTSFSWREVQASAEHPFVRLAG